MAKKHKKLPNRKWGSGAAVFGSGIGLSKHYLAGGHPRKSPRAKFQALLEAHKRQNENNKHRIQFTMFSCLTSLFPNYNK